MNTDPESKRRILDEMSELALAALRRARKRAEEIAARTGTALIESDDGKPVRVQPPPEPHDK